MAKKEKLVDASTIKISDVKQVAIDVDTLRATVSEMVDQVNSLINCGRSTFEAATARMEQVETIARQALDVNNYASIGEQYDALRFDIPTYTKAIEELALIVPPTKG